MLPHLALPAGDSYFKIFALPGTPEPNLQIFITSSPLDLADAGRGVYIDESIVTPADLANPRNPLNASRSALQAVKLANGTWYELQLGESSPWPGSWELNAVRGNMFLIVQGVDSRAQLEQIAGSLTQDW